MRGSCVIIDDSIPIAALEERGEVIWLASRAARPPNSICRILTLKRNKEEQEIEALLERGDLVLSKPGKKLLKTLSAAAENTFRKDRRINIRLSERDMVGIQRVAAARGVPYQSLISGLIHQYVEGDLVHKS